MSLSFEDMRISCEMISKVMESQFPSPTKYGIVRGITVLKEIFSIVGSMLEKYAQMWSESVS